jgi:hypothetical protein
MKKRNLGLSELGMLAGIAAFWCAVLPLTALLIGVLK